MSVSIPPTPFLVSLISSPLSHSFLQANPFSAKETAMAETYVAT